MNTYWPVRPRNRSMSLRTCPGVKATQSTTASKSRSLITSRTDPGSRMSACSTFAPGGSGRTVFRPRFSTNSSIPLSTATREHAELMTPLPPMNSTLSFVMPLTLDGLGEGRGAGAAGSVRRWVPGLVDGKLRSVGQADRGHQAPALIGDLLRDLGSPGPQFGEGGVDVVAHQVELMAASPVGGMTRQLSRRQGEDEPASARVDAGQADHVREEIADLLRFGREHDRVHPVDHAWLLVESVAVGPFQQGLE